MGCQREGERIALRVIGAGGTVIVETLFGLPGLGQLVASSITSRDVIMVQGIVVFIAVVYVCINTLVDLGYQVIDPRVGKVATA